MQYIRDEAADETIRNHDAMQDVVNGRVAMLWLPGAWSGLAAQMSLMFGWAGISLSVLWLWPLDVQHFMYFMIAAFVLAGVTSALLHAVVTGRSSARTYVYRFCLIQSALAASVLVGYLILRSDNKVSVAMAATSLVLSAFASRLVSGTGYALLAAIYRAQRLQMEATRRRACP
jgi:hypothetical protein